MRQSPVPYLLSPIPRLSSRRGVLLLLILALLAMFGLIGMAFVVMTGQAQRGAKSIERIGQTDSTSSSDAHQLLQQAMLQVLRGSNNPTSVMGVHSLLEDIYGNEYLTGTISNVTSSSILEVVNLTVGTLTTSSLTNEYQVPTNYAKLVLLAQHVGGVLTITDVPTGQDTSLVGQSTRIVASSDAAPLVQITAFPNGKRPPIGSQFIINGIPCSGTGFGYNPNSGLLDLRYDFSTGSLSSAVGTLTALLPNISPAFYITGSASAVAGAQNNRGNPPGGANEDYDAADFQNLLLAAQVQIGAAITTLPSLHRPALINYWMHNNPTGTYANFADFWKSGDANKALCRKIMLRPIGAMMANQTSLLGTNDSVDHPDFNGSNPNFDPTDSTKWDVDNDGDGKPDSVWVDLGMPVRTTADGRAYKPLFAILCIDLDGRLNLNAHGCLAQTDATRYNADGSPVGTNVQTELNLSTGTGTGFFFTNGTSGGTIDTVQLPRGQGYGPAEISLAPLFNNLSDYGNLLTGTASTTLEGRYGKDKRGPGFCDQTGNTVSGLSLNRWYGYWNPSFGSTWSWWNFLNGAFVADAYGSPPDTYGKGAVALDVAGRPLYLSMGDSILNAPYELNLGSAVPRGQSTTSTVSTPDAPFSPAELERVLRPYDRDTATLPARLTTLAPGLSPAHRMDVTTDSWDIPSPAPFRQTSGGVKKNYPTIAEFLLEQNVPATQLTNLLPLDILSGRKMDVTRLLSQCTSTGSVTFYTSNGTTGTISVPQCFSQDGNVTDSLADRKLVARQLYARYLYVLALLCDDAYWAVGANQTEIARQTAQWAVNVVDFQTNDSAMTPFQYTVNPFGAACWTASTGTLDTDTNVVWGCKRPELLISETLAFHDRRTQDEKKDTKDNSESANHTYSSHTDGTFDQKVPPRGALFIELFNPWTNLEAPPTDLYRQIGATSSPWGVDLDRVAPNGNPVWRMVIVDGADAGKDPDDPDPAKQPNYYERAVYFAAGTVNGHNVTLPADTKAPAASTNNYVRYQPPTSAASQFAPILPGRYAVIGPNGTTYIGRATDGSTNNTPYIRLTPNTNPDAAVDQVHTMSGTTTQAPADNTRRAVAITIEPAAGQLGGPDRSFCVSEPIAGYEAQYPSSTGTATYGTATGEYVPANDIPIDTLTPENAATSTTTFTQTFKVIYLQRLADPSRNFDATGNPYRTIDVMSIDLQSFNGLQAGDPASNGGTVRFHTRERGATAGTASSNLWQAETSGTTSGTNSAVDPDLNGQVFQYRLVNTLSYLNSCFGATAGSATYGDRYVGDPQTPFPWLYWPNRPMVSQMGLLLTPGLRSSQLLANTTVGTTGGPYTVSVGTGSNPFSLPQPFPYLGGMFQSPTAGDSPGFYRILDYVYAPSRFAGTETQLWNSTLAKLQSNQMYPPFNRISAYREPGRINLNTLYSPTVWGGLMASFSATAANTASFNAFLANRRGDTTGTTTAANQLSLPGNNDPTEFPRPFHSGSAALLVPDVNSLKPTREINGTLLREGTPNQALFEVNSPLAATDTDKNPFFRYQNLMRLGNLVTTRSNVYAVWITVGYFEVASAESVHPSWTKEQREAVFPDGFCLGRELGSDTGEVERHRAFYIIDRTLPVGFQRGQDLNVDKAILINRYIE